MRKKEALGMGKKKTAERKAKGAAVFSAALCTALLYLGGVYAAEEKDASYCMPKIRLPESGSEWYREAPEIEIIHQDPYAVTVYMVETPSGRRLDGMLEADTDDCFQDAVFAGEEEGKDREEQDLLVSVPPVSVILPEEVWEEGTNLLSVYMESRQGEELYRMEKEIRIDTEAPQEVGFSCPDDTGNAALYSRTAILLDVRSSDQTSGVKEIVCTLDNGKEYRIKGEKGRISIPVGYFGSVQAYATDHAGRNSKITRSKTILSEDQAPDILMDFSSGPGAWHTETVQIKAGIRESKDKYGFSAGLANVTCYVAGEKILEKNYTGEGEAAYTESVTVEADKTSKGGNGIPVLVRASDRAGNTAVKLRHVYIDRQPPRLKVTGAYDTMITGKEVKAVITADEENILQDGTVAVTYTTEAGEKKQIINASLDKWNVTETGRNFETRFTEEGIYECLVSVSDAAGHRTEEKLTFTIDRTSPAIRYVDGLNGAYIRFFQWSYGKEEMIRDFTDYQYAMYLDGKPYFPGTRIQEEGIHILRVEAEDGAGNRSCAKAVFTIDHTSPQIWWEGAEDGGTYEEAVFSLWVDGKGERLKSLTVNREKQTLGADARIYQRTFEEAGIYCIEAEADDLAGNQSAVRMVFEVREQKSGIGTIIKPVTMIFSDRAEEENGTGIYRAAAALAVLSGTVALCAVVRKRKNRNHW